MMVKVKCKSRGKPLVLIVIHVIVITWKDIDKITDGENWIETLTKKFYLPTKFIEK